MAGYSRGYAGAARVGLKCWHTVLKDPWAELGRGVKLFTYGLIPTGTGYVMPHGKSIFITNRIPKNRFDNRFRA